MTGPRTAVAVLLMAAAGLGAGFADRTPARPVDWQQRLDTARVELEANTTALHAAHLTGQPINRLQQQCHAAVADYNTAAPHTNVPPLDPSKECTP